MAKTVSEQDLQLRKRARRRLIGAIAVVLVVVIFLPMVLDREPRPVTQNIEIQIPSPDKAGEFNSKIVPVAPKPAEGTAVPLPPAVPAPVTALPASSTPSAPSAPDTGVVAPLQGKVQPPVATPAPAVKPKAVEKPAAEKAKPAEKPKAEDKPKPKTDKAAKAAAPAGGFVVQVAALTDAAKAKQIEQRMGEAGVKAYTELLPTAKGNVTRVRAGPYKTREEAEKARDKLKSVGLSGNVVAK